MLFFAMSDKTLEIFSFVKRNVCSRIMRKRSNQVWYRERVRLLHLLFWKDRKWFWNCLFKKAFIGRLALPSFIWHGSAHNPRNLVFLPFLFFSFFLLRFLPPSLNLMPSASAPFRYATVYVHYQTIMNCWKCNEFFRFRFRDTLYNEKNKYNL